MILGYCPEHSHSSEEPIFPFDSVFSKSLKLEKEDQVLDCDAVILWGGTDIYPSYYYQSPHPKTQNKTGASKRDLFEWSVMQAATACGVPIIGVCRGAQFLCVFAGGSLFQHTTGHHGGHEVLALDGGDWTKMDVSSDHHQMMDVRNMAPDHARVLAFSVGLSSCYETVATDGSVHQHHPTLEPEVVWFPKFKGLSIQPHPEWMQQSAEFVQWTIGLASKLVLKEDLV